MKKEFDGPLPLAILLAAVAVTTWLLAGVSLGADPVAEGEKLFEARGCYECHTIAGIGYAVGPMLDGFVKAQIRKQGEPSYKAWLREFLRNPSAARPGTAKPMLKQIPTDEEFEKIWEFIKSV